MADEAKHYRNPAIVVTWQAERCIHSARCVRALPQVFDPRRRPWIILDDTPADAIAAVVQACPSGALHFERLDGGGEEPAPNSTVVQVVADGPLYLHGPIEVRAAAGRVVRQDTRMALCRCGASRHKPFCDNSHFQVDFRDAGVEEGGAEG